MSPTLLIRAAILSTLYTLCASAYAVDEEASSVPRSNNQIIKLTDSGIVPSVLHMKLTDSIVFVLNDTKDALATIVIDFGKRQMHCSGSNLETTAEGQIRSKRPFAPRDFASTCFHEPGSYSLTAYGLKARPQGITAQIIVE